MMLSLTVLGSSSRGNCGLLIAGDRYFLIDAGFSGKKIQQKLSYFGIALNDLSGVFVTHEHSDHTSGLKVLRRVPNIKFYANFQTAQAIESLHYLEAPWALFNTGKVFSLGPLSVQSFSITHDASDPVGFLFQMGQACCAWATDIGQMTDAVKQYLNQADTLVLESNHEPSLLWGHPTRPQYLKERIAGPYGHLSNHEAFSFLKNSSHTFKKVYLSHVSRDCNSVAIMKNLFQPLAQERRFELEIIDPVLNG